MIPKARKAEKITKAAVMPLTAMMVSVGIGLPPECSQELDTPAGSENGLIWINLTPARS